MEAVCIQGIHVEPISSDISQFQLSYLPRVGVECKEEPVLRNWSDPDLSRGEIDTRADQCSAEEGSDSPSAASVIDGISLSESEGLRWHGTQLASYCPAQRVFRCGLCSVTAFVNREMAEHWLGAHAAFKAFQCPRCPYMSSWQRCVRMHLIRHHNDRLAEVVEFDNANAVRSIQEQLTRLKRMFEQRSGILTSTADYGITSEKSGKGSEGDNCSAINSDECPSKRHHCPYCPYSTHRRDLFNRHENIHKSDKPFHCYICKKMFNRADHVKKHFLRIHREVAYDVKRIRRIPPKTLTAQVYYARAPMLPACEPLSDCTMSNKDDRTIEELTELSGQGGTKGLANDPSALLRENDCNISEEAESAGSDHHSVTSSTDADSGTVSPQFDIVAEPISSGQVATNVHDIEHEMLAREKLETLTDSPGITSERNSYVGHESDNFQFLNETMGTNQSHARSQPQRREERHRRKQECYSCPQCPWKGFDSWCLKRHVNTHIKPFTCTLCPYKAARSERLSFHVTKVHSKRICVKCFWICEDSDSLNDHMARSHGNSQNRQEYTCLTCACTFRTPEQLESHMVSAHSRKVLNCNQCNFHTTDADVLQDHVRYSHETIRDAPANTTSAAFSESTSMTPVILKVPSVSPALQSGGQCMTQTDIPLLNPTVKTATTTSTTAQTCYSSSSPVCVHRSSEQLQCKADHCHFQSTCSRQLDLHVRQQHDDQLPRCPHCALPLATPLELCMHWPLHHATLCWHCVLLVQRHCVFLEQLDQPDGHQLSSAEEEQVEDFSPDNWDCGACPVSQRDIIATTLDQRYTEEKDNHMKRSRKQPRPKRCLVSEKENTII